MHAAAVAALLPGGAAAWAGDCADGKCGRHRFDAKTSDLEFTDGASAGTRYRQASPTAFRPVVGDTVTRTRCALNLARTIGADE